jgi:hypothetical protein
MYTPRAFNKPAEFEAAVQTVAKQFAPDVVEIRVTLEEDWSGDPAAGIMVIVADSIGGGSEIHAINKRVKKAIWDQLDPPEEWGVYPYFSVRTHAEQAQLDQMVPA